MKRAAGILLICFLVFVVTGLWFNYSGEFDEHAGAEDSGAALVDRGAYLARAGNCIGCHSARGGEPYAGGRGIPTPFGTIYTTNLTPDAETGLGQWTRDDFWRALHNGRSKDGRFLYPAFPYTDYTRMSRSDSDALHAYFQSLRPVRQLNKEHRLRFPYNTQLMLAAWRTFFFRPGIFDVDNDRSESWNRGAFLVNSLGHCGACHAPRNAFGATMDSVELSGGLIPMQGWYAPSLASPREAGMQHWQSGEIVALLRDGISPRGSVLGPMAEVVYRSTQYLNDTDLRAIATYLQTRPERDSAPAEFSPPDTATMQRGVTIYKKHCADCHGDEGKGFANQYPALAGNRAVNMEEDANLILSVLNGGFAPATKANPRPYGMPPFATVLSEDEVASALTYIRNAWGNRAPTVRSWDVSTYARGSSSR